MQLQCITKGWETLLEFLIALECFRFFLHVLRSDLSTVCLAASNLEPSLFAPNPIFEPNPLLDSGMACHLSPLQFFHLMAA